MANNWESSKMYPTGLDFVLSSAACRGAFIVGGNGVTPLAATSDAAKASAMRTRDVWASLTPIMSDAGFLIGEREAGVSIVSRKGGVIVEASGAVNLGILRAALQNENTVDVAVDSSVILGPCVGTNAIWALADWIDAIEAPRQLRLHLGEKTIDLTASKGRFAVADSSPPASVVDAITAAAEAGTPIELSYAGLPDSLGPVDLSPLDLFCPERVDSEEWIMGQSAMPLSVPVTASFAEVRQMAVLAQRLAAWGNGAPFELSILRNGTTKEVVARATNKNEIRMNLPQTAEMFTPCQASEQPSNVRPTL